MFFRFFAWRRTPAGIWSEWFAWLFIATGTTSISYIIGFHWAVTVVLGLFAAALSALIFLMLWFRNDLGDLPADITEPSTQSELKVGVPAVVQEHRAA